ncbi:MAG TPA: TetR/AcrR family transcriptional regulator [Flavipsychrobacter sp.]|nr:TetR/AcrR family transcriptional regulator [Flavipsychrobacter sp.]
MSRKDQIIEKAIDLFSAESFESVGIQKLAAASGVAQGLLYRHFKNKNDLLLHLVHKGMVQVQHTLQFYANDELSFQQAFEAHIDLSLKYLRSDFKLWKILHNTRQNAALMSALKLDLDPSEAIIEPIRQKLHNEGIARARVKAWHIFTLIDGITSLYLAHPEHYPLKKMEKFLNDNINLYVSKEA